jgi:hypothetical protein
MLQRASAGGDGAVDHPRIRISEFLRFPGLAGG